MIYRISRGGMLKDGKYSSKYFLGERERENKKQEFKVLNIKWWKAKIEYRIWDGIGNSEILLNQNYSLK